MHYPEPISKLIDSFMKLPGIGPKTAARLAFFVLTMKEDTVLDFAKALVDAKRNLRYCSVCGHITDIDPCHICQDKQRDRIDDLCCPRSKRCNSDGENERLQWFYHVLHGAISPMDGIGPEDINVPSC